MSTHPLPLPPTSGPAADLSDISESDTTRLESGDRAAALYAADRRARPFYDSPQLHAQVCLPFAAVGVERGLGCGAVAPGRSSSGGAVPTTGRDEGNPAPTLFSARPPARPQILALALSLLLDGSGGLDRAAAMAFPCQRGLANAPFTLRHHLAHPANALAAAVLAATCAGFEQTGAPSLLRLLSGHGFRPEWYGARHRLSGATGAYATVRLCGGHRTGARMRRAGGEGQGPAYLRLPSPALDALRAIGGPASFERRCPKGPQTSMTPCATQVYRAALPRFLLDPGVPGREVVVKALDGPQGVQERCAAVDVYGEARVQRALRGLPCAAALLDAGFDPDDDSFALVMPRYACSLRCARAAWPGAPGAARRGVWGKPRERGWGVLSGGTAAALAGRVRHPPARNLSPARRGPPPPPASK